MSSTPAATELQRLWFATLQRAWGSLVVVPAHPGAPAHDVAYALAEVGSAHRGKAVSFLSAEGLDVAHASRLIIEMTTRVAQGGVVVVLVDCPLTNAASIPIALAADAALLCVELGKTDIAAGQEVVQLLGVERFLGTVTVRGRNAA